jgi:hypothetical protein
VPLSRYGALPTLIAVLLMAPAARADSPTKSECVAANETAQDLRTTGKLRAARQKLAICTADSCPGAIREDCAQRLQEVGAAMPTLMIEAVDVSGHDLTSVRVVMDGAPLVTQLGGAAIEVDPGEHRFVFDAEGFNRKSDTVLVREGQRNRNLRVVLEATPPQSAPPTDGSMMRNLGIGVGAAGAVGIVVGSILGLVAKGTYDHAFQDECRSNINDCTPAGTRDGVTAHNQAAVATAGFVIGGALLVAGATFYFTAPRESGVAVTGTLSNGGGGLAVRGRW